MAIYYESIYERKILAEIAKSPNNNIKLTNVDSVLGLDKRMYIIDS